MQYGGITVQMPDFVGKRKAVVDVDDGVGANDAEDDETAAARLRASLKQA